MRFDTSRALIVYSGLVTGVLCWILLTGAAASHSARFDTIEVHRIDLREDDGTIRMIIASRDHFPGVIVHGQERPHPGRADAAGMIFYNDEGTENGGLIFGGQKTAGKVTNFGHLSFDQYEQDQVVNLEQTEEGGKRYGGLTISDYPDAPIDFDQADQLSRLSPAQRATAIEKLRASGAFGRHRVFIGKSDERDALVALQDGEGRVRLRLRVTAEGGAAIEFLDRQGKVVKTDSPGSMTK